VRGVGEVERLAVAPPLVGVDEEDLVRDGAEDEGVGDGAADGAGADDGDGGGLGGLVVCHFSLGRWDGVGKGGFGVLGRERSGLSGECLMIAWWWKGCDDDELQLEDSASGRSGLWSEVEQLIPRF
jgi:hypothetical protein